MKKLTDEEIKNLVEMVKAVEGKGFDKNRTLCRKLSKMFDTFILNMDKRTLEINGINYKF